MYYATYPHAFARYRSDDGLTMVMHHYDDDTESFEAFDTTWRRDGAIVVAYDAPGKEDARWTPMNREQLR